MAIVNRKYASKQIGMMDDKEISKWGPRLLKLIHVVTGWRLPSGDDLILLLDQFQKKMVESYGNTTVEEIEYVFREQPSSVEAYGTNLNLGLIDKIMIPYLERRMEVSNLEARINQPKLPAKPAKPITDQEMVQIAFFVYQNMKKIDLIPVEVFEYLTREQKIVLTDADQVTIKEHVYHILRARSAGDPEHYRMIKNMTDDQVNILARNLRRKYAVSVYFDKCINEKVEP